jgi:hypothetical protein
MNVLVLNTGSSTVKFQIISTDLDAIQRNADQRLARGSIERIGGEAAVHIETENGSVPPTTAPLRDIRAASITSYDGRAPRLPAFKKYEAWETSMPPGIAWFTAGSNSLTPF